LLQLSSIHVDGGKTQEKNIDGCQTSAGKIKRIGRQATEKD